MNVAEAREMLAAGESIIVEFKRDAPLSDEDLVEAVVCFANTEGGVIFLGVEDDGSVSGLHATHLPLNPRKLEAMIANRTIPGVRLLVETMTASELPIAVIHVAKAPGVVQTTDGKSLHRFWAGRGEPECRPMRPNEIASRLSHLGQLDFSARLVEAATWDDLNPLEFERVRQALHQRARADKSLVDLSDEALARALELVVARDGRNVPTVSGLLLLGRDEAIRQHVSTHEAAFQVLAERQRIEVNEFYREPLLRLFERFEQLIEARNSEEEFSLGIQRIGIPRFPKDAVREALANALVHRDYSLNYAVHVKIDPLEGGLVITNPGGFVEGITVDNLLVAGPRPRNRALADAFKRLGLVERAGRGVERIFEYVLELGRPAPTYAGSDRSSVRVLIPDRQADVEFVRLIIDARDRYQRSFDWRYLLVLRRTSDEGEVTSSEVANLIQRDAVQARALLEELVELGMLEAKGPKRTRSYHLSASVFERLGRKPGYARRRGLDELKRRQLIKTHLQAYGRITRSEVAELCRVTPRQAEYLLRKLRDEGEIMLSAEAPRGKFAFYVPTSPD